MIEGHYIEQYNKLGAYRKELLRRNSGSTVEIMTEMDGSVCRFKRMYVCFQGCKEGWLKGCRPLIGLDGCHIKGHHPGQLLTAIGIDANNGIFPIAYAVAERESEDTWTWFLEYLQHDIKIERDNSYAFITDKQKGLEKAIKVLFPNAEHRHCVRHLHNNFKQKHSRDDLKLVMWNAARSTTVPYFNKHMDEMRMLKEDAAAWFNDKSPSHWSRAFFKEDIKCDTLLNNLCESFNASILPARDKPILAMLERIRMNMMVRNANRRVACEKWNDVVGPRIRKTMDKVGQNCTNYRAHRASDFIFQVIGSSENGGQHAVDLGLQTCTCRRWQLSGIPCVHAMCCIRFKKQNVAFYCHDYLMSSTYKAAYTPIIHPISGVNDWEPVNFPLAPPLFNKLPGRPRKKRIPSKGEVSKNSLPAPNAVRLPKTGVKMTCKVCGQQGHNKLGCPITRAKKAAEDGTFEAGANTNKRVRLKVQRVPAPTIDSRPIQDQIIKSKKGWKKMKMAMAGTSPATESISTQPLLQFSQVPAARVASSRT